MNGQESVKVYIYDLSKGMARTMSAAFLGKQIDGIWHTGIVAYGREFYYGGGVGGIETCTPGQLPILGQPDQIVEVGKTEIPFELFMEHLKDLATSTFRGSCYHLLEHNCNTFSNEVALFLTGKPIPSHITNLPQEVMSSPLGAMIKPMIDAMHVSPGGTPMFETEETTTQGASAYPASQQSAENNQGYQTSAGMVENEYFPKTSFLSFDTANVPAILGKVKDFNTKVDADLAVEAEEIDQLEDLIGGTSYHSAKLNTLLKLLKWPSDLIFPVLDVLRLSVRNAEVNQYLCGKKRSSEYMALLRQQLSRDHLPANQMLALRTLCNTFSHILGKGLLTAEYESIVPLLPTCVSKGNKNIQIAATSLILNFAVIFYKNKDLERLKLCLDTCDKMCGLLVDTEAYFRLLVCIGTVLSTGSDKCSGDTASFVQKCIKITEPPKVGDCAKCVYKLMM